MFISFLLTISSLAQEVSSTAVVGNWAKIGECEYQYTAFRSDGSMILYQREQEGEQYISAGLLEWWKKDGHILVGKRLEQEEVVAIDIQSPSFTFQLFSGTIIFANQTATEFVWERCD